VANGGGWAEMGCSGEDDLDGQCRWEGDGAAEGEDARLWSSIANVQILRMRS